MDYDTFLKEIIQVLPKYATSSDIEKVVREKIPSEIDKQYIIFKSIKRRKMELHTGEESIDDIFQKIVLTGIIADVLTQLGRNNHFTYSLDN